MNYEFHPWEQNQGNSQECKKYCLIGFKKMNFFSDKMILLRQNINYGNINVHATIKKCGRICRKLEKSSMCMKFTVNFT